MEHSEKIGKSLSGIKKDNPFKVPDQYFSDFQARLSEKIREESNQPKVKKLVPWKTYAAAAVLLIMALLGGRWIIGLRQQSARSDLHAQISVMVENELYSINEQTILDVMEPEVLNSSVKADEAMDYLNDNSDVNELLNEL
ncbi:MAG TPA: hypothetical protein VK179_04220 [Bacteroidales bacterium]|nr:hypothetical protein [Bacteroidales bacterium]